MFIKWKIYCENNATLGFDERIINRNKVPVRKGYETGKPPLLWGGFFMFINFVQLEVLRIRTPRYDVSVVIS